MQCDRKVAIAPGLTIQRMLALTRAALHGTVPEEHLFAGIGEKDWDELFEQLTMQGVMAMTLAETMRLPKELQPPRSLKMRWIASVESIEKNYGHRLKMTEELTALFRENNIRTVLFKGFALARLYPVPAYREFGDIDIFLCGKAKEGDAVLKRIAGKKLPGSEKHADFSYKGVLIENHHTFLNQNSYECFSGSENLEKRLLTMLEEAGMMNNADITGSSSKGEALLFPPPEFDALFVTLHLLSHWTSRIVLRQLCDLVVLFTAYRGKIDLSAYRNSLSESGLLKLTDAFISLSVRYLGLNPEYAPPYKSDESLENRIWNDMLSPEIPPLPKEKRTLLNTIIYKIRLLRSRYWKNEMLFPGQFGKKIIYSGFFYFRHPEIIRK